MLRLQQAVAQAMQHVSGQASVLFAFRYRFALQIAQNQGVVVVAYCICQLLCYWNPAGRRGQQPAQFLKGRDVVAQDGFARLLQRLAGGFGGDMRVAVTVAADPGTEADHRRQRLRRDNPVVGFMEGRRHVLVQFLDRRDQ